MPQKTRSKSKRFSKMPITKKVTFIYTSLFFISIVLLSMFIFSNSLYLSQRSVRASMEETADKVEKFILAGGELNQENLDALNDNKFIELRLVNTSTNEVVERLFEPDNPEFKFEQPPEPGSGPGKRMSHFLSNRFFHIQRVIEYNGESYIIQLFKRMDTERAFIQQLLTLLVAGNVICFGIAFGVGKYISKRLIGPIKTLTKTADRISIEDLSSRIPIESSAPDDEMKELAITFNNMIARLENSFEKQNRFVSDASHELRTPLSVIKGYANLMDRWGKNDEEVLQESIDSIKSETENMSILIKRLLFLARSDQKEVNVEFKPINIIDAVDEMMKEMSFLEGGDCLILVKAQHTVITGDYTLIKQLIKILTENALKYAQSKDKPVEISVYNDGEKAFISVKDYGVGISDGDLPYIFDRFFRADKSRNKEVSGSGLGLSIAKWIAEVHEADILVDSELGKGTEFKVVFKLLNIEDSVK